MIQKVRRPRPQLRQAIIILPSAFTMANLFFGVYAMVAATRGDFIWAGWFIVFAGVLDMMDGRIARFTRTGSTFGAELDSLVDAISFGVAPAFIIYSIYFNDGTWSWLLPFVYVMASVMRLARFNVEQGGEAKRHFHGLPSPTAGMILATFYPFSQTPFVAQYMPDLPSAQVMGVTTVLLGTLMLSHIPYPLFPRISLSTRRGVVVTVLMLGSTIAALVIPRHFIFPFLALYTTWGLVRSVVLGLLDRLPEKDPLMDELEGEDPHESRMELRSVDYADLTARPFNSDPKEDDPGVDDS